MVNQEFEPREPLSPQQRFYSDMVYKHDSYIDLYIAAQRLLLETGVAIDGFDVGSYFDEYIPNVNMYENNIPLALEQFSLIPLKLVAPRIEEEMQPTETKRWYDEQAKWLLRINEADHNNDCLRIAEHKRVNSCDLSLECPVAVLVDHLLKDVRCRDFEAPLFMIDPPGAYMHAYIKLKMALKYDLADIEYCAKLESDFSDAFNERFFAERAITPSDPTL